ncbi:MAG: SDR family oxidoreductase [Acetobacteraceae bacterium]
MAGQHDGKVAVITGGARGIGLASAVRLSKAGFRVALSDLEQDALDTAAAQVAAAGGTALTLAVDVRHHDRVQAAAASVIDAWGRIDVLVNSAGVSMPKGILAITESEWDLVMDINLKGTFNWCKAAAAAMVAAQRGRIVNISSVNAHTGGSPSAVSKFAYAASKAGVLGLTRGLAQELGPHVTVSAICPGLIETRLTADLVARQRSVVEAAAPLQRVGTPEDIAAVVEFLATVEPNYITGEIIDVDGGLWIN